MHKPIIVYIAIAFAPAVLYRGFRPPRGLHPDVRNRGKFVRIISTTLLRPMIVACGISFSLSALFHDFGKNSIAIALVSVGVVLFLLMGIPGVISFLQFYDLDDQSGR